MAGNIIDKVKSTLTSQSSLYLAGRPIHNRTGFGLMGMTWRASPPSQQQSFSAMKAALSEGSNFWNGGEIYGNPDRNSLHLLNEYFTENPNDVEKVVISIKGGCLSGTLKPDGSEENTRRSIQECIDQLKSSGKKLDIWESARVDPNTPIEITMRAAKKFIDEGELGGVALSECSADTIRRAAKVVKISAVEVEVSLWATEIFENGIAQACAELDIPIVAYSPLGRGFLTGQIKKASDIPEGDMRRHMPRFQEENFDKNLELVTELEKLAKPKGCTTGQIALSWVLAKSGKNGNPTIVPIPGSTTPERVKENLVQVDLSENDIKELDALVESVKIIGGRYPDHAAGLLFGSTPELKE